MKNKVYLNFAIMFIIVIAGLFAATYILKTYTKMYEEKEEEIDNAIKAQAEQVPKEHSEGLLQDFNMKKQELRSKEQFLIFFYLSIFLIILVTFLVLMLKKSIVE